jgi:3',5'-cyclic AMP phosphodiesterase CpdA
MLIAQITDMHVMPPGRLAMGRVDTNACLARAVESLLREDPRPAVVLATGDLVDAGTAESYAMLRRLLAPLAMPVFLIPGNHDDRRALADAFPDHAYLPRDGLLNYVVEDFPVRLIGLDTLVPGEDGGRIGEDSLAWLEARLGAAPARPTLVFLHHPPVPTGIEAMDAIALAGADGLAAVIARHPQVERVAAGHVHRSIHARFAGTMASIAPSSAHQLALDLRPGATLGFTLEPPGYHLHRFAPGSGIATHAVPIGGFAGPFAFPDGAPLAGPPPR